VKKMGTRESAGPTADRRKKDLVRNHLAAKPVVGTSSLNPEALGPEGSTPNEIMILQGLKEGPTSRGTIMNILMMNILK